MGVRGVFLKHSVVLVSFFSFLFGTGQAGAGSCRGSPADCEKSRRTANGKGLYSISPCSSSAAAQDLRQRISLAE